MSLRRLPLHILFVCTGNICRSPTAERLAALWGEQRGIGGFRTSSAGTRAVIDAPIHSEAERVLRELGGNGEGFRARQFTPKVASDVDLVLTMTRTHRDAVLERAPRLLRKTFTLVEAAHLSTVGDAGAISDLAALRARFGANDLADVQDPIGQSADVFTAVGKQIAELLPPILDLCERSWRSQS